MFGVNFSVSAGRCTSGVYMKVIQANKREKELSKAPHDFLLVIDTEGLNSPELLDEGKEHERDNELATLAVGLGSMSLINIMGETMGENMKDIIQIVILAFLRMKMSLGHDLSSKKDINSCMLLHQNVSSDNAEDKLQDGLKKLVDTLDFATGEAAKTENVQTIRNFRT